jgi:hypothetical protein
MWGAVARKVAMEGVIHDTRATPQRNNPRKASCHQLVVAVVANFASISLPLPTQLPAAVSPSSAIRELLTNASSSVHPLPPPDNPPIHLHLLRPLSALDRPSPTPALLTQEAPRFARRSTGGGGGGRAEDSEGAGECGGGRGSWGVGRPGQGGGHRLVYTRECYFST